MKLEPISNLKTKPKKEQTIEENDKGKIDNLQNSTEHPNLLLSKKKKNKEYIVEFDLDNNISKGDFERKINYLIPN